VSQRVRFKNESNFIRKLHALTRIQAQRPRVIQCCVQYLRPTAIQRPIENNEKIIFFGRSLGSAVAVDLAVKEKCCALILETPFTSIKEMGKTLYPFLSISLHFLRTKYDSLSKISKIKVPTLIMHGDKDELVPIEQGKRLYEKANEPKEFYTIPGAMHNDTHIVGGEEYFDVIRNFVNKL